MKTQYILSMIAMTVAVGSPAWAGVANMAGTWQGSGAEFSLEGDQLGGYQVQLVDTLQADGSIASAVTVTIPGNPTLNFDQTLRDSANGFSIVSSQGNGGASCLGEGLCEGYVGDANGNGVAMTVISDGPGQIRILKVELQGFKAQKFYREKYVRTQSK